MTDYVKVATELFRLIGAANDTPSLACDIALGRFVAAHEQFIVDLILNATTSGGTHLKLSEAYDKYIGREREREG